MAEQRASDGQTQDGDARALWEDLAAKARRSHCPEHIVAPWKVVVIGDAPDRLRLQVYGCCPRLEEAVSSIVRSDPRISGPS